MTRVVDTILVDDQRSDEAAELQQRVPIPAVAGEPGGLDRYDSTDTAFADGSQQLLESGSRYPAARSAEVIIDHRDVVPPELPGALR